MLSYRADVQADRTLNERVRTWYRSDKPQEERDSRKIAFVKYLEPAFYVNYIYHMIIIIAYITYHSPVDAVRWNFSNHRTKFVRY